MALGRIGAACEGRVVPWELFSSYSVGDSVGAFEDRLREFFVWDEADPPGDPSSRFGLELRAGFPSTFEGLADAVVSVIPGATWDRGVLDGPLGVDLESGRLLPGGDRDYLIQVCLFLCRDVSFSGDGGGGGPNPIRGVDRHRLFSRFADVCGFGGGVVELLYYLAFLLGVWSVAFRDVHETRVLLGIQGDCASVYDVLLDVCRVEHLRCGMVDPPDWVRLGALGSLADYVRVVDSLVKGSVYYLELTSFGARSAVR